MMILWRIYYAAAATFDNTEGAWKDAPRHGLVCVVVRDPTGVWGRFVNHGYAPRTTCPTCGRDPANHWFVCPPDMEEPYATWDLTDFRARFPTPEEADPYIKTGRMVSQMEWQIIMDVARRDPDFPISSPRRRVKDWKPDAVPSGD